MAHFYITGPPDDVAGRAPAHPGEALDMSVRKLQDIKEAQRATHRQANLRKTVLVYNMFRRAAGTPEAVLPAQPQPQHNAASCTPDGAADDVCCGPASIVPLSPTDAGELQLPAGMDVDIDAVPNTDSDEGDAAAEQSWFDHCLDRILAEDDLPQPPPPLSIHGGDNSSGCALKRSQQAPTQSLCALGSSGGEAPGIGGQCLAIPAQAVSECDLWAPGFGISGHMDMKPWEYASLLVSGAVTLGALEAGVF
ncbi:hypothetical protein H4R19_002468 [Coemansia spiralis]|nr:hypothetical protein H4R19_002468 [Coemansia spiralis]